MIAANEVGPFDPVRSALEMGREMLRTQRREVQTGKAGHDKYARFYRSRAWRAARYSYLRSLKPERRRCMACGATAVDTRLAVDHIVPLKTEEGWVRRLDQTNFQILCAADCNLAKGSGDSTDFRTGELRE
jgi:5-methylcytosine-specific restriction endonuclease McrA